jgi:hypothetical protein
MSGVPAAPPSRVPTLTEVLAWPDAEAPPAPPDQGVPPTGSHPPTDIRPPPAPRPEADLVPTPMPPLRMAEDQVIQGVLAEVQRQVELMLEYRVRETLTPLLNRAADTIVREARTELASTLRDVVARAVAQELLRHRTR